MNQNNKREDNNKFIKIIIDALKLFKNNYFKIFPIFLFFSVINLIIKVFSLTEINYQLILLRDQIEENSFNEELILLYFGAIIIEFITFSIFTIFALSLVSRYLYKRYTNQEANFLKDLKKSINKHLIVILLLLGVCVPFGMILILPGLLIYKYSIFSIFTYNIPEIKKPLSDAKNISEGYLWRIIIILILTLIIGLLSAFPVRSVLWNYYESFIISRDYGMLFLFYFVCNIISIILSPLIVCLLTSLFHSCYDSYKVEIEYLKSLREKKENYKRRNKDKKS